MPRAPRYVLPGVPHHVIHRGNNRQDIFFDDTDRKVFLRHLGEVCANTHCAVHAYVLMTNHIHLLATPAAEGAGLSRMMQALGRRYASYVNRRHGRTGSLFEGRFRCTVVDTERYLLACQRYIELNPVRAGLAARPGDYRWSSFRANGLGVADAVVSPHPVFAALGGDDRDRRDAYVALFADPLEEATLTAIRDHTNRGWALGDEAFVADVTRATGVDAAPRHRGRPRLAADPKKVSE